IDALEEAARELAALFGTAVLLKGGHLDGPECVDLLLDHGHVFRFAAPRVETSASHGTGCTLSAAITAGLAHGQALPDAVSAAKQYLGETLRRSYTHHTADGKPLSSLNQGTLWI